MMLDAAIKVTNRDKALEYSKLKVSNAREVFYKDKEKIGLALF